MERKGIIKNRVAVVPEIHSNTATKEKTFKLSNITRYKKVVNIQIKFNGVLHIAGMGKNSFCVIYSNNQTDRI